jgi:GTP-binding protein
MKPVVSIVGKPDIGKSTLFNRFVGSRKAIVDDTPGVTRDRHYGKSYWNGRDFTIIDTGGYVPDDEEALMEAVREQVHVAMAESDLILFTVDVKSGIHALDRQISRILREQEKPVIVVVNKADNEKRRMNAVEFYELGFDELHPVSATSGMGSGDLLDLVVDKLPRPEEEESPESPRLSIVGRPNVGKSSYVNALLNSNRSIVSEEPGTTRDSINSRITYQDQEFILVDTAGLRKKSNVDESIEYYSTIRTHRALKNCDVAVVMVDAMQGFEKQDMRIVGSAADLNKGIVIALNKWDLVPDKTSGIIHEFEEYIYSRIPQLDYIPIVTISSTENIRLHKVLDVARHVINERKKHIPTSELNAFIRDILKERPLPHKRGQKLKITYATQVKTYPPVFKFFMNSPEDLPSNQHRYIEHRMRQKYNFEGVPLTFLFRQK